jgi:hypothetical protein
MSEIETSTDSGSGRVSCICGAELTSIVKLENMNARTIPKLMNFTHTVFLESVISAPLV